MNLEQAFGVLSEYLEYRNGDMDECEFTPRTITQALSIVLEQVKLDNDLEIKEL